MNTQQINQEELQRVPFIDDRAELVFIIKAYAVAHNKPFHTIWGFLYSAVEDHTEIEIQLESEKIGLRRIDYIERKGMLPIALKIAKEIFR